jgi:hypothetical protein
MIYSKWRPSDGKYEYFESSEKFGLGDDMPVPSVPFTGSPIGVASVVLGRKPSGRVRRIGEGEAAIGAVMPTVSGGMGIFPDKASVSLGLALLSGIVIGYLMKDNHRDNTRVP